MNESLERRFWRHVAVRGAQECWEWMGAKSRGYGVLGAGKRGEGLVKAHRVSWELHNGPVPDAMFVCHRCDNPPCVNPGHLFLGTPADNAQDMATKGRHGRWTRPLSTARGSRQGSARLTESEVRRILAEHRLGLARFAIANIHAVSYSTVQKIVTGESWRHITQEDAA